jgi:rod shape-determining protein MreC
MGVLRNRSVVVALLLLVALLAGALLRPTGYLQPVENVVFTLLTPLQYSFHWTSSQIASRLQTIRDLGSLEARVRELQATVDQLMIENVRLHEADLERTNLREQLHFQQSNPTYEMLAAEVIGYDPSNLLHYLLIDRGTQDGVAIGMPVVTARGLVGSITAVYPHSARVMLLTDPSSSVNALIQSSRATGIVQGQGRGSLTMRYVEQGEEVKTGDIVLTSGLGGNFPKRLVIGQVTLVKRNDVDLFQEIQVQSAVAFDRLETVLVIQNFQQIEYAP